jgi:hypothetical protein
MRKFLASVALCLALASTPVQGQTKVNLPVACYQPEAVATVLEKYREKLVFVGLDNQHNIENLNLSVFFNKETKTYSVVLIVSDKKLVCVVSSGSGTETP